MSDVVVSPSKNGPLLVSGSPKILGVNNASFVCDKSCALCRCGQSNNKPFCDGSHAKSGFVSKRENETEQTTNKFESDTLTVLDTPKVCAHAGFCDGGLPDVFWTHEGDKRIAHPKNESDVEKLKAVIKQCPSGSLAFEVDGELFDKYSEDPSIFVAPNGPYVVKGGIEFKDEENQVQPQSKEHYTLCRCGQSKNKPFCDGSHHNVKFDEYAK